MSESFPRSDRQSELGAFDPYRPLKSALRFLFFLAIAALLLFAAFKLFEFVHYETTNVVDEVRPLMATTVEIKAYGKGVTGAVKSAFDEMDRISRQLNVHDSKSEVGLINSLAGAASVVVSHNTFDVIDRSVKISERLNGYFDISIGAISSLWNFSEPEKFVVPTKEQINERLKLVDYRKIELDPKVSSVKLPLSGMSLDLSGVGKGYVLAIARNILISRGIQSGLISAGSSIICIGKRPDGKLWRVGIRSPRNQEDLIGIISLAPGKAVSTSGDYEQYIEIEGKRYHPLLDPSTGYPASLCQSVTIIANDSTLADALSTAVFVMGPKKGFKMLASFPDVEALIVDSSGNIQKTPGFPLEQVEAPAQ